MPGGQEKELQQYRNLVEPPSRFEEGFGGKTILGALFMGLVMVPGSIYMQLFMGASLGPAARWVTVILFAEVAKRSMKTLRQQEVFILFYMTGIALSLPLNSNLLWSQYLAHSQTVAAMGVEIPKWIAPSRVAIDATGRTFFSSIWVIPMLFLAGQLILSRIDNFGLGYALYRMTCYVEKLPFPMAPVDALGVSALADVQDKSERWRWRWFSIGAAIGLGFGVLYVGVPAVTGALLAHPIEIIPVPWLDLTGDISKQSFMPATAFNLVFDLGLVILGMVLPFWAVVGGFLGMLGMWVLNPFLYRHGMLPKWVPGSGLVDTVFSNTIDFYLSFSIGLALAVFAVSLLPALKVLFNMSRRSAGKTEQAAARRSYSDAWRDLVARHKNRGDISIFIAIGLYVGTTLTYIALCLWLMPGTPEHAYADRFPWPFFLGFGLVYQPTIAYITAKIEGIVGQTTPIPLVRESAYILSGYTGSAIWFAPIPINDYAGAVRGFRVMELTGTRLTSLIKTEIVAVPVFIIASIVFWNMLWRLADVPSEAYPFAQQVWDLRARNFALTCTATSGGSSQFIEAIKFPVMGWGLFSGLAAFALLSFLNFPTLIVFGVVRFFGLYSPGEVLPEILGALVGRFYLERRYGHQNYKRYSSLLLAGYGAGVGLVAMASVAFALISKSTTTLGY